MTQNESNKKIKNKKCLLKIFMCWWNIYIHIISEGLEGLDTTRSFQTSSFSSAKTLAK